MKKVSRHWGVFLFALLCFPAMAQELQPRELLALGAVDAARLIREGAITSTALVEATLARVHELESLNAYITLSDEFALEQAARADEALANGKTLGRLHGVPIAVKDNIEVAGIQHTAGTPGLSGYVPDDNAPIIQALIDEGVVVIGKNNMHELAMGITSNNIYFGAVGNAYRADHFAGGSSGGTGAAVAANIATVGLGSDTGGSVRIPAAVNGVYGLRPTTGRYSQVGITPLSSTRDTAGPIGKSVADLALVDAVITGREDELTAIPPVEIRVGIPTNYYFDGVEGSVEEVIRAALEKVAAAGVVLVEVELPELAEMQRAAGTPIRGYEGGPLLTDYLKERTSDYISLAELINAIGTPSVKAVFAGLESGENAVSVKAYRHAIDVDRPRLQKLYSDVFSRNDIDAIVFPTTIATAKPIAGSDEVIDVDGKKVPTFPTFIHNTSPGSLAGIPGVTLPAGLASDGMPVGLGLDGPEGSDVALLSIAMTIEEILGFKLLP